MSRNPDTELSRIKALSLQITDTQVHRITPIVPKIRSQNLHSGPADLIAREINIVIEATHLRYQSKFSGYQLRSGLVRPCARTCGSPFPVGGDII